MRGLKKALALKECLREEIDEENTVDLEEANLRVHLKYTVGGFFIYFYLVIVQAIQESFVLFAYYSSDRTVLCNKKNKRSRRSRKVYDNKRG